MRICGSQTPLPGINGLPSPARACALPGSGQSIAAPPTPKSAMVCRRLNIIFPRCGMVRIKHGAAALQQSRLW